MHIESLVAQMDNGKRLSFIPWPQADKAGTMNFRYRGFYFILHFNLFLHNVGKTTCDHSFAEADKCQEAYHYLWDAAAAELRDQNAMPKKAPAGHLLVNMYNSQNDHAKVELTRVDCIELAIQSLLEDDTFEMNRATCTHHKIGLIAEACQKADAVLGNALFGEVVDKEIREFKSKNPIDMFQRQLALLFGKREIQHAIDTISTHYHMHTCTLIRSSY